MLAQLLHNFFNVNVLRALIALSVLELPDCTAQKRLSNSSKLTSKLRKVGVGAINDKPKAVAPPQFNQRSRGLKK
jgi:hypothetical protein